MAKVVNPNVGPSRLTSTLTDWHIKPKLLLVTGGWRVCHMDRPRKPTARSRGRLVC